MSRRGHNALVLSGFLFAMVWPRIALADDNPSPIRQFDLPTIEKLGREIYDQDQEAWKATDVLTGQYSADQLKALKLHGWIVDTRGSFAVVRFVRDGASGPEIFCDVNFAQDFAPTCTAPQDNTLDPDELRQYDARMLALKNADPRCSDTYNTVALKDPQGDGWLVWAMAATKTDADLIIIGGHYRFTISADGTTVLHKDALSKSCIQFHREKGPNGELSELVFTHVISPTPVETHVFASLSYKMPFRIGTTDGRAWKVDADSITNIDMDMPGVDGVAARYLASLDENCFAIVNKADDPNGKAITVPIKSVIEATEKNEKYTLEVPADDITRLIGCSRDDFALAPNDYKVLFAGIPFMIMDRGIGHPQLAGTLYVEKGQFRFETEKSAQATADELSHIGARLDAFQKISWPKQ